MAAGTFDDTSRDRIALSQVVARAHEFRASTVCDELVTGERPVNHMVQFIVVFACRFSVGGSVLVLSVGCRRFASGVAGGI